jgi:Lipocalin-like domain
MLRTRYLLIPYIILMYACGIAANDPIIGKWQVVKEVNKITDAKIDTTTVKISNFTYDLFNFKTAKKLEITINTKKLSFDYSINNNVLQFTADGKTNHYGIQKVDQDSLVLYREENWANTIRISSTLYCKRIEK